MNQNQIILKKQFDTMKDLDNPIAKKKHYTKTYYYQNKERYKKYYQDNKESIKEYAKNYKNQKQKKSSKKQGVSVEYGIFILDFNDEDEETIQNKSSTSELGKLSFLQFFQQQQAQAEPLELEAYEEPSLAFPQKKWKLLSPLS